MKIQRRHPHSVEVFLCFETKRNDVDRSSTKKSTQRISAEELGTMAKNYLRGRAYMGDLLYSLARERQIFFLYCIASEHWLHLPE